MSSSPALMMKADFGPVTLFHPNSPHRFVMGKIRGIRCVEYVSCLIFKDNKGRIFKKLKFYFYPKNQNCVY